MFFPENLDEMFLGLRLILLGERGRNCDNCFEDETVAMFDKILTYRCNTSTNKKILKNFVLVLLLKLQQKESFGVY